MLNDSWFSKQIDNIFGPANKKNEEKGEDEKSGVLKPEKNRIQETDKQDEKGKPEEKSNKEDEDSNNDYKSLTKEHLKAENDKELKNKQTSTSSKKGNKLQGDELDQTKNVLNSKDDTWQLTNNNFPLTPLLIVSIPILAVSGIYGISSVVRKSKKIKK